MHYVEVWLARIALTGHACAELMTGEADSLMKRCFSFIQMWTVDLMSAPDLVGHEFSGFYSNIIFPSFFICFSIYFGQFVKSIKNTKIVQMNPNFFSLFGMDVYYFMVLIS